MGKQWTQADAIAMSAKLRESLQHHSPKNILEMFVGLLMNLGVVDVNHAPSRLVFVSYTHHSTKQLTVSDKIPDGVTVNYEGRNWTYRGETQGFGDLRPEHEKVLGGFICVYDALKPTHIQKMLYLAERTATS